MLSLELVKYHVNCTSPGLKSTLEFKIYAVYFNFIDAIQDHHRKNSFNYAQKFIPLWLLRTFFLLSFLWTAEVSQIKQITLRSLAAGCQPPSILVRVDENTLLSRSFAMGKVFDSSTCIFKGRSFLYLFYRLLRDVVDYFRIGCEILILYRFSFQSIFSELLYCLKVLFRRCRE